MRARIALVAFLLFLLINSIIILNVLELNFVLLADLNMLRKWYPDFFYIPYSISLLWPFYLFANYFASTYITFYNKTFISKLGVTALLFILSFIYFINHDIIQNTIFATVASILIYTQKKILVPYSKKIWKTLKETKRSTYLKVFTYTCILLIILGIAIRLHIGYFSDNNIENDAACRFFVTKLWLGYYIDYGTIDLILSPNKDWPPLHFYLNGLFLTLYDSFGFAILMHSVLGIVSGIFVYNITKKLSGNKPLSLIASIAYLYYPLSMYTSAATLSEPVFMMLILITVDFFISTLTDFKVKSLVYHLLFLGLACLVRYEAWPLICIFPLVNVFHFKQINKRVFSYFLVLLAPVFVMTLNEIQGHGALKGLTYVNEQVGWCFDRIGRNYKHYLIELEKTWIPGLLIFSIYSLIKRERRITLSYAILVILFILPFLYKVLTFTIMPDDRYHLYYTILLMPLWVDGLLKFLDSLLKEKLALKYIIILVIVLCSSLQGKRFYNIENSLHPEGFKESVEFVNQIDSGKFIIDYHKGVLSYQWVGETMMPVELNYEEEFLNQHIDFDIVNKKISKEKITKTIVFWLTDQQYASGIILEDELNNALNNKEDFYIIIFPESTLNKLLGFSKQREKYRNVKFKKVYQKSGYYIYKSTQE